ncbi:MAG: hypothetical protein ACXAAO_16140 [Candidatus Thorarchaeota archaeon]|jgi:A/G-specific adenine glycosylase
MRHTKSWAHSTEDFQKGLHLWWSQNQRTFPWRRSRDPYEILIAEILLHRTRAEQALSVYPDFIVKYPTVESLASAPRSDVLYELRPLGLRWRAEFLHDMARLIQNNHGGKIPIDKKALEHLPGVSHYIASAVRCFAFGKAEVLLDTNTVRITGRLFGIQITDGSRRSKRFQLLLENLLDINNPRQFNLALIDLGASVCKPKNPLCGVCPAVELCNYSLEMETRA